MNTSITSDMHTLDVTTGQKKQLLRFTEDAIEKALKQGVYDRHSIQTVITRGAEFNERIAVAINDLCVGNRYEYEDGREPKYELEYKVKSLSEQMDILRNKFPELADEFEDTRLGYHYPMPVGADGYFVIPRWQLMGKTYDEAVTNVISRMRDYDKSKAPYKGEIKLTKRTEMYLSSCLGVNLMVLPAQFGSRHIGRSLRRAREVFGPCEFGLGAFEVGIMILTHPERGNTERRVNIVCAGDEVNGIQFDSDQEEYVAEGSTYFELNYRKYSGYPIPDFHSVNTHTPFTNCAAATAFLPRSFRKLFP